MTQAVSRWPLISETQAPIPVVAPFKAYVCGRSLAEIAGSNPADSMDICVVCCRGTSDMRTRCKGIQWITTERKKRKSQTSHNVGFMVDTVERGQVSFSEYFSFSL